MTLVLATNNTKKLLELREILSDLDIGVISMEEAGISGSPEETGETFEENARIKALAALKASGMPSVADDSGLIVDALGGRPGVYSSRYGGDIDDSAKCRLLLSEMEGIPDGERTASFACSIVCLFPDGKELTAFGACEGVISRQPSGNNGFGYDPVFFLEQYGKTMAELPSDEKNIISHRGKSLKELAGKLSAVF